MTLRLVRWLAFGQIRGKPKKSYKTLTPIRHRPRPRRRLNKFYKLNTHQISYTTATEKSPAKTNSSVSNHIQLEIRYQIDLEASGGLPYCSFIHSIVSMSNSKWIVARKNKTLTSKNKTKTKTNKTKYKISSDFDAILTVRASISKAAAINSDLCIHQFTGQQIVNIHTLLNMYTAYNDSGYQYFNNSFINFIGEYKHLLIDWLCRLFLIFYRVLLRI